MNFFEHQDRARRSTTRLVFLFIFAVLAIITALNLAAYAIARGVGVHEGVRHLSSPTYERVQPLWSNAGMYQWVTVGTLVTILSGTLYKTVQLRKGGAAVAQMLGGTPLIPNSGTPADRQLQNIVEEMSIASGVPVPQVYVMRNEPGINAFAAGFGPQDAVISVTQGCIDQLNRDELQGVIAHEFSHILNGDMRLNLRLIGILHGILLIALIGYFVLRSMFSSSSSSSSRRSSSKDGDGGPWIALIIGLALVAIGYIGVFFGRLIQAAVSRQREFLADASAVQFTRNPSGIANALKKIAAASAGSQVDNAQALGTAHLFFASAFRVGFVNLLATHPPLVDRIKAIDPTFDGKLPLGGAATEVLDESSIASRGAVLAGMLADATVRPRIRVNSREVVERAGTVTSPQVRFAEELVAAIPGNLRDAAHDPFSTRALVLALLTNDEPDIRGKQLSLVKMSADAPLLREYERVLGAVDAFHHRARLPLLNLSLSALRELSPPQAKDFLKLVGGLIQADQRVTLFEFALFRILQKQLSPDGVKTPEPMRYFSVSAIRDDAAMLLSALASASTSDTQSAFEAGARTLDVQPSIAFADVPGLQSLDRALQKLSQSSPPVKKRVIAAAAATVAADGEMNVAEAELLRAASATLGVPIPLFLAQPGIG